METPDWRVESTAAGPDRPPSRILPLFRNFLRTPVHTTLSGLLPFSKKPLAIKKSPPDKSACQNSHCEPLRDGKDGEVLSQQKPRSLFVAETRDVSPLPNGVAQTSYSESLSVWTDNAADASPVPNIDDVGHKAPTSAAEGISCVAREGGPQSQECSMLYGNLATAENPVLAKGEADMSQLPNMTAAAARVTPMKREDGAFGTERLPIFPYSAAEASSVLTLKDFYSVVSKPPRADGIKRADTFLSRKSSANHDALGSNSSEPMKEPIDIALLHDSMNTTIKDTVSPAISCAEMEAPSVWVPSAEDSGTHQKGSKNISISHEESASCRCRNAPTNPLHENEESTSSMWVPPIVASKVHEAIDPHKPGALQTESNLAIALEKSNMCIRIACSEDKDFTCLSGDCEASEYKASRCDRTTISESVSEENCKDDLKPQVSVPKTHHTLDAQVEMKGEGAGKVANPGARLAGRRKYDSVLGETCHWCRQKTVEDHVQCWKCPLRFCGMCLLNRNGEYIQREMQDGAQWLCPKCRGGCGPGCDNCCNCGPCRREQRMGATGNIIKLCRAAGFTNAHDYLVHQETGEPPDVIASRKDGCGWINGGTALLSDGAEHCKARSLSRSFLKSEGSESTSEDMDVDPSSIEAYKDVSMTPGVKRKGTGLQDGPKRLRVSMGIGTPGPQVRAPRKSIALNQKLSPDQSSGPETKLVVPARKHEPKLLLAKTDLTSTRVKLETLERTMQAIRSHCAGGSLESLAATPSTRVKSEKLKETMEGERVERVRGSSYLDGASGGPMNSDSGSTWASPSRKVGERGTGGSALSVPVKMTMGHWEFPSPRSPASHSCVDDTQSTAWGRPDDQVSGRSAPEAKVKAVSSVEDLTPSQASGCKHDPSPVTKDAISGAGDMEDKVEHVAKDVMPSQESSCVQAPPPITQMLSSDSCLQDSSVCPKPTDGRVRFEAAKVCEEGLSQNPSTTAFDLADGDDGQTSGLSSLKRQRKDVHLGDKWSLPSDVQGDAYSQKLKQVLAEPDDWNQLSDMCDLAARRKPVLKLRQTRGRTMHVTTEDEGLSYLDHHPDLALRLKECSDPLDKLVLLRGFFFWLQHSCMEGAYKPWVPTSQDQAQGDDCILTDGPDCEVLAVVLALDDKKDVSSLLKPADPVVIDLDDDDVEEIPTPSVQVSTAILGARREAIQKTKVQKAITCINCCKEFGMEKKRQRALYESCGHIETCVSCVDTLWKLDKHRCPKCGLDQAKKPRAVTDFAHTEGEPDIDLM